MQYVVAPSRPFPPFKPVLGDNAREARYGVSYVRALCSQAGVSLTETSPDEDAVAIDATLLLKPAFACVQVKCTSQFKIRGRSASWEMELHCASRGPT